MALSYDLSCNVRTLPLKTFTHAHMGISHVELWIAEMQIICLLVFVSRTNTLEEHIDQKAFEIATLLRLAEMQVDMVRENMIT